VIPGKEFVNKKNQVHVGLEKGNPKKLPGFYLLTCRISCKYSEKNPENYLL